MKSFAAGHNCYCLWRSRLPAKTTNKNWKGFTSKHLVTNINDDTFVFL